MIILLAAERHNALARRISSVTTWHRWTCVRERTDWSRQPSRTDSTCYRSFRLAARQPASWQVKSVMIVNVIPLNYFDCWQEIREPWRILSFFTRWWFASTTVSPSLWSSLIQRGAMKYCFRKPVVSLLLNFSTSPTIPATCVGYVAAFAYSVNCVMIFIFFKAKLTWGRSNQLKRFRHCGLFRSNDTEDTDKSFTLSRYFFDATELRTSDWIDSVLRGLTKQTPLRIDTRYTTELQNKLFR